MSKVIHLSRAAHERAKHYCHQHGLPMSDWVASLIDRATHDLAGAIQANLADVEGPPRAVQRGAPPQEQRTRAPSSSRSADSSQKEEAELAQMYTAPPFWARDPQAPQSSGAEQHR